MVNETVAWLSHIGIGVANRAPVLRPAVMLVAVLAGALPGQAPRLVDSITQPLAYLSLEAAPAAPTGSSARRQPSAVQSLLADPALAALLAPASTSSTPAATSASDGATKALALVRGLLARSSGELEIALTGVVPDVGQPLLVLRARLHDGEAKRLQDVLAAGELAAPSRQLGSRQAYRLRGDGRDGVGQEVELAVVGDDLVVGNDTLVFAELLQPAAPTVTTASVATTGLAADPRYQALRKQSAASPGALRLYVDWPRLGQRLRSSLDGMPGALLASSGLGTARAVMATVDAANGGFAATLLLDFAADGPTSSAAAAPAASLAGWFAAVQPVAARTLLGELPNRGLGGLVLSVGLAGIFADSHDGAHLLHDIEHAFDEYGLDWQRNVESRLGDLGTVQLQLARSTQAAAELRSVYALKTKGRNAATELFADLRRATEAHGLGRLVGGRERRGVEVLELRGRGPNDLVVYVAAGEDELLIATEAEIVAAAAEAARNAGKPRARREQLVTSAVQSLGSDRVAGLFDVDLVPLFEQLAAVLGGVAGAPKLDLSQLPKRHVGCLDLQPSDSGTLLRIRVLSSR